MRNRDTSNREQADDCACNPVRYDLLRFSNFVTNRYDFVTIQIRFIRPDFALILSSFVYIEDEIWSDETDWNRNLGYDALQFRYNL